MGHDIHASAVGGPSGDTKRGRAVTVGIVRPSRSALILIGVIVLLLLVAVNDDGDQTIEVTAGDTTATTEAASTDSGSSSGSGGSSESGGSGGGELPAGEYRFTLTAAAGTVEYSGSCNVVEGILSASGAGAQEETIVLRVDVIAQTGTAQVAALGSEFEGTINSATTGDQTFQVGGFGSEADDSATGSSQFTVAGGCNTAGAGGGGTPTPTATATETAVPGTHAFTVTIPEGTASLSGTCVVADGQLAVQGSGEAGESLSISANVTDQTGSMSIAAAGVNYEGTVTSVVIGDGTFEVSGTAVPSDDSATGEVPISASGGCDTPTAG